MIEYIYNKQKRRYLIVNAILCSIFISATNLFIILILSKIEISSTKPIRFTYK